MWNLFQRGRSKTARAAPRVALQRRPEMVYAIGDVHGCLDDLKRLEDRIIAQAIEITGQKLIVMLGDYIDRGPKSAQTIDWLLRPAPAGFDRICLRGNHEALFHDALSRPERCGDWLNFGGRETLHSYGINPGVFENANGRIRGQMLQSVMPDEHRGFLDTLPVLLEMPGYIMVHAGIRPGIAIADQSDDDLIWIREPFLSQDHGLEQVVVHGHTPAMQPAIFPHRIGIDTMAYGGGVLTALSIPAEGPPGLLTS